MADTSRPQYPVPHAPAPWNTKSECYWLFLALSKLPEGLYDPLEASSEELVDTGNGGAGGEFRGGLGVVMIVRYRDTPVGPYDELILIPGNFAVPQPSSSPTPPKIPKKALRISRIYVSQRTTCYNGRLNWNIPKHLARFTFSAPPTSTGSSPPLELTAKVFPPSSKDGNGTAPFFAVTLKPWRWVPSMPISSRWLPLSTVHAQPPLPEAASFKKDASEASEGKQIDPYDIDPRYEEELLAGTDRWCIFPVNSYVPRARGCWVSIHEPGKDEETGDAAVKEAAKYWPVDVTPWSIGAWMEDAELGIPEPLEWKL
ncbi:hypothetical protein K469DRAFT_719651 [Zopfia rhizophila CBS 207.26]|uniref:Uncharacterized protein n=1 Tax=Zopfia rhizophila CBS 207.26 TaxID=1314779 RepID=A0A6A6DIG2_9PEZI|nr:hypothetical protein K469DRAFT_719651 [Zopfia rhizophila CBS 207.26]